MDHENDTVPKSYTTVQQVPMPQFKEQKSVRADLKQYQRDYQKIEQSTSEATPYEKKIIPSQTPYTDGRNGFQFGQQSQVSLSIVCLSWVGEIGLPPAFSSDLIPPCRLGQDEGNLNQGLQQSIY